MVPQGEINMIRKLRTVEEVERLYGKEINYNNQIFYIVGCSIYKRGEFEDLKIFIQNEKGMEKILTSGELLEQCSIGVNE